MTEAFELPPSAGVPIVGGAPAAPARTDQDEAIARLAMFVSILAEEVKDKMGAAKAGFIMVGAKEILDRYGPVDVTHEFGNG